MICRCVRCLLGLVVSGRRQLRVVWKNETGLTLAAKTVCIVATVAGSVESTSLMQCLLMPNGLNDHLYTRSQLDEHFSAEVCNNIAILVRREDELSRKE